jgi:hypothetical protein
VRLARYSASAVGPEPFVAAGFNSRNNKRSRFAKPFAVRLSKSVQASPAASLSSSALSCALVMQMREMVSLMVIGRSPIEAFGPPA